MSRVLLLGAGLVAPPMVKYLLAQPDYYVTIATQATPEMSQAENLVHEHPRGKVVHFLADDVAALDALVTDHDLAISLLPYSYHVLVARICIKRKKHMVNTSYISPQMEALDEAAKQAGVIILNEIGVDPGIDHMSAMRVIRDVGRRDGRVTSLSSLCGGLPAPDANTNPWGYKVSWSPRGVLLAGNNDGRFLRDGKIVDIPKKDLFAHYETVSLPDNGNFEAYTNRDCLRYIDLYGLNGILDMFRGTLRNPGWCDTMKAATDLGLLDDTERTDIAGKTYKDLMGMLVPNAVGKCDTAAAVAKHIGTTCDSMPIRRLEWLGLFSDDFLPEVPTILDVMVAVMLEKMSYAPYERDMVVLYHRFKAEFPDHKEVITSTMVDFGIPNGDSAMARTVSLPAAIGTKLILEKKIGLTGVLAPVSPEIFIPVLVELEQMGIICKEQKQKV